MRLVCGLITMEMTSERACDLSDQSQASGRRAVDNARRAEVGDGEACDQLGGWE